MNTLTTIYWAHDLLGLVRTPASVTSAVLKPFQQRVQIVAAKTPTGHLIVQTPRANS